MFVCVLPFVFTGPDADAAARTVRDILTALICVRVCVCVCVCGHAGVVKTCVCVHCTLCVLQWFLSRGFLLAASSWTVAVCCDQTTACANADITVLAGTCGYATLTLTTTDTCTARVRACSRT